MIYLLAVEGLSSNVALQEISFNLDQIGSSADCQTGSHIAIPWAMPVIMTNSCPSCKRTYFCTCSTFLEKSHKIQVSPSWLACCVFCSLSCLSMNVRFGAGGKHRRNVSFQFLPSFPEVSSPVSCSPLSAILFHLFFFYCTVTQSLTVLSVPSAAPRICVCVQITSWCVYTACVARSKSETQIKIKCVFVSVWVRKRRTETPILNFGWATTCWLKCILTSLSAQRKPGPHTHTHLASGYLSRSQCHSQ